MQSDYSGIQAHYDRFLAHHYLWMAGGFAENADRNRALFQACDLNPRFTGCALDLGAGCGFQSVPLAEQGFRVTAVDLSRQMLDELRCHDPAHRIEIIHGDIMDFPLWTGKRPELIVCMGDTLTHLPDPAAVRALFRQCYADLVPGGTLFLSFRDYAGEPEGTVTVLPVRRDTDRIFLCRLVFGARDVSVTDILYSRMTGTWERAVDTYRKRRLAPEQVSEWIQEAGFQVSGDDVKDGMVLLSAKKSDAPLRNISPGPQKRTGEMDDG